MPIKTSPQRALHQLKGHLNEGNARIGGVIKALENRPGAFFLGLLQSINISTIRSGCQVGRYQLLAGSLIKRDQKQAGGAADSREEIEQAISFPGGHLHLIASRVLIMTEEEVWPSAPASVFSSGPQSLPNKR